MTNNTMWLIAVLWACIVNYKLFGFVGLGLTILFYVLVVLLGESKYRI